MDQRRPTQPIGQRTTLYVPGLSFSSLLPKTPTPGSELISSFGGGLLQIFCFWLGPWLGFGALGCGIACATLLSNTKPSGGIMLGRFSPSKESLSEKKFWRDLGERLMDALVVLFAFLTPMLRRSRARWGSHQQAPSYPGDQFAPCPAEQWTHGVIVNASPREIWPWLVELGQKRAELPMIAFQAGRWFLLQGELESSPKTDTPTGPRGDVTHLFWIEPLVGGRSRVLSRFRVEEGGALPGARRSSGFGREALSFAADRRMLLQIKQRAESALVRVQPIEPGARRAVI